MSTSASQEDKYILHVTAGPTRERSAVGSGAQHQTVPVNTEEPVLVETESVEAKIWVRIRGYRGLPRGSPESAPYFEHPKHRDDRYSIQFNFKLKEQKEKPNVSVLNDIGTKEKDENEDVGEVKDKEIGNSEDKGNSSSETPITGDDILLGNDFDRPIRDKLPPGFSTAFRIVKWFIDPGLDGDVDADEPYLYGPLLSSINTLEFGDMFGMKKEDEQQEIDDDSGGGDSKIDKEKKVRVLEESGPEDDAALREKLHIPTDSKARMKYFLNAQRRKEFVYERGREYRCDFYNPYLDFNEFALRLPGFTLNIMSYWDGQPLRYVLKNRYSNEVYFVVTFDLLPVDENGELLLTSDTTGPVGLSDNVSVDIKSGVTKSDSAETKDIVASAAATAPPSSRFPADDEDVD